MQKILVMMMAFALTIGAQAERIDSTQFVAFYNYTIQTQDDEGQNVTDSLRLALLVGTRATYCTTVLAYNRDGRASSEMMNAFIMHHQNVLTDVEKSEVTALEPIYPYRYLTKEPLAKVDWTLDDDTLAIGGLPCHRATGEGRRQRGYSLLRTVRNKERGEGHRDFRPSRITKVEPQEADGIQEKDAGQSTLCERTNLLCSGRTGRFWRNESQWCCLLFCQPYAYSSEKPRISTVGTGVEQYETTPIHYIIYSIGGDGVGAGSDRYGAVRGGVRLRVQDAGRGGDTRHGQDAGCGAGGTDGDEVDAVIRLSTD